jgi:NADH-quinone oxidoreductase subunit J
METAIFLIFAALALGSALMVVTHKSPVYATMSLVVTLFSLAVMFVLLGAPFIGALQVLVYAGAIVVLFLFVLMLLNISKEEHQQEGQTVHRWVALLGAGAFVGLVVPLLYRATQPRNAGVLTEEFVSIREFARDLFTRYLLQFEIVGLLLLVAVVAATVVARKPPAAPSGAPGADSPISEVEP